MIRNRYRRQFVDSKNDFALCYDWNDVNRAVAVAKTAFQLLYECGGKNSTDEMDVVARVLKHSLRCAPVHEHVFQTISTQLSQTFIMRCWHTAHIYKLWTLYRNHKQPQHNIIIVVSCSRLLLPCELGVWTTMKSFTLTSIYLLSCAMILFQFDRFVVLHRTFSISF